MIAGLIDFILHIDVHLDQLVSAYGALTYVVLFLIVFCETGLVVTPFLPGDSLLFAAGAIASRGGLNPLLLMAVLIVAAILGDALNYTIGFKIGPKVLEKNSRLLKVEHIKRTERFYEKYGGKTIIFARFVPIVRTFAPFLAGVGKMNYVRFARYNVIGGLLWVIGFVGAGVVFGEIPAVKKNFTLVIIGIIVVSIMPAVFEWIKARRDGVEVSVPNA